MEFRILGPLEVVADGHEVALGGARPKAVLALLLMRPNEVVSADRLIDELWGANPPRAAANTIQQCISQLRKQLGADRIETRPPGYVVRVDAEELDLARFESLVGHGDVESLRQAVGLWRGSPLADLAYEQFVQAEIARLDEMRAVAHEKLIDCELELGRHAEVVAEIERLVAEHPLRERLRAQQMLALYRAGRQAEALSAYREARTLLVEEMGIEPGAALQELERAILRHDPSLDVSTRASIPARTRSILVLPSGLEALDPLLALAEPLAVGPAHELIVASLLSEAHDLSNATTALAERRADLAGRGLEARVAAYRADAPGDDAVQLATEQDSDLVLVDAPQALIGEGRLDGDLRVLLESAPCDVGVLVRAEAFRRGSGRPVVVPFGGVEHDWSAVEIAGWIARSLGVPLRLTGTEDVGDRRDASRLLARASLVVQSALGIVAEPALVPPGAEGVLQAAAEAGVVVLGLSERWRAEGIGEARLMVARDAACPTLLVRRGLRPGGLAPPETMTRFTWTMTAG